MKKTDSHVVFSPGDLVVFFGSPFASWMDRYHLEMPGDLKPDAESDEQRLIVQTGLEHERDVLEQFTAAGAAMTRIDRNDADPLSSTVAAVRAGEPIIYQAALADDRFAGFADFLMLNDEGRYQVWDTKLARSPKPNYVVQLCCYSEMFAAATGLPMPDRFGIILGNSLRPEFRVEDFIHYYRHIRQSFLALQDSFTGDITKRPEPLSNGDHGRWTSHAEQYFAERDHLVRVAGITTGQIKKLAGAGVTTVAALAAAAGTHVPKLAPDTLEKLVAQARLQDETLVDRRARPDAPARYEILSQTDMPGAFGLATLPEAHSGDVFFDMEGYPLFPGGLEYLFGAITIKGSAGTRNEGTGKLEFHDWWAHDRAGEKLAFEGFIDWVYERWRQSPGMHIYHYAPYEVTAVRRLSTQHDTRQDEVDDLLRNQVFVDLYKIVRQGLRIGEDSYSIKKVERFYRGAREGEVTAAGESIVQYARWLESRQPRDWRASPILRGIRDYNEDDCVSTEGLFRWLKQVAAENNIVSAEGVSGRDETPAAKEVSPEVAARLEIARRLRERPDALSRTLGDLVDFHRREAKPMWWRMFDRAGATPEELCDDASCVQDVRAVGEPWPEKQSLLQKYAFDAGQECKLAAGDRSYVMFCHNIKPRFTLVEIDAPAGELTLKISNKSLKEQFGGKFPARGSLLPYEDVPAKPIPQALADVAESHLNGALPPSASGLLERVAPAGLVGDATVVERAMSVTSTMTGGCLVIQGPPGTGKTYTAARVINSLVAAGKRVGVSSNGHKAILNLLRACGEAVRETGGVLRGVKVKGDGTGALYDENPAFSYVGESSDAFRAYSGGVIGATAWTFTRPEWIGQLDFLFIDEAGQVSLANTVAMSQCTQNLVLLGDQMQLEQPVQGSHPGDAGLSGLLYALKDIERSLPDVPAFHAVVPDDSGLFLAESWRMHPAVCGFISESIYEGRLRSVANCERQRVGISPEGELVRKESGIVFSGIEHDGNVQQSDEEVERVVAVLDELMGRPFTSADGRVRPLSLDDFLFIAPYNAQVRALESALPTGARVGSVDKFQGQEAPVCILSLCSSFGEYGPRGLGFILDRNRINVAVSRAQCLAVVVADPRIAGTRVGSIDDMRLLNLFCKLVGVGRYRER